MTTVSISRDALERAIEALESHREAVREIFALRKGAPYNERDVLQDSDALAAFQELDRAGKIMLASLAPLRAALTAETKIPGREEIAWALYCFDLVGEGKPMPEWREQLQEFANRFYGDKADAVLSLLPAQAEKWRDIASAPEDRFLWTWREGEGDCCISYRVRDEWWTPDGRSTLTHSTFLPPTHWRPLPPPPELKSKVTK